MAAVECSSNLPRLGAKASLTIQAGVAKDVSLLLSTTADGGTTPDTVVLQEIPDTVPPVFIDLCRKVGQGWEKLGETRLAIESLQGINETDRDVSVQLMLGKLHRQLGQKMLAKAYVM